MTFQIVSHFQSSEIQFNFSNWQTFLIGRRSFRASATQINLKQIIVIFFVIYNL